MIQRKRSPFDLSKRFIAVRDLVVNGHEVRAGEEVKWKEVGLSEERLYSLWSCRRVSCEPRKQKAKVD